MCCIIIDFKPLIKEWSFNTELTFLYNYFPLRDIISTILHMRASDSQFELFWLELEVRSPQYEHYYYDNLAFIIDLLVEELDLYIRRILNDDENYAEYILNNWITETSAILSRDLNVGTYQSTQFTDYTVKKDKFVFDLKRLKY